MKASGHGATSSPIRYAPSSLANRHATLVWLETITASFCITLNERAKVRMDCPFRLAGGAIGGCVGAPILKKSGLPESSRALFIFVIVKKCTAERRKPQRLEP